MSSSIVRLLNLLITGARQALPLNGILSGSWRPVTVIAVYWLESFVLVLLTALLCWLVQRRTSDRAAASRAGVNAKDVLLVHLPSLAIFGVFVGIMLNLLIREGHTAPFDFDEFRAAAYAMLLVIGVGSATDLTMSPALDVAAVADRVDGCMSRWALFWILGFFGLIVPLATERLMLFLTLFVVLKALWEGGALLERLFGGKRA